MTPTSEDDPNFQRGGEGNYLRLPRWFHALSVVRIIKTSSMTPGRIAGALAVLAVFCVLAIFFFPGMEGPYPAVHGPVTALLSIRAAARLRVLIRAGVRGLRSCFARTYAVIRSLSGLARASLEFASCGLNTGTLAVLRC